MTEYLKYKRPGTKMLLGPLLRNLELEISKAANEFLVKMMLWMMIRDSLKKKKKRNFVGILSLKGGVFSFQTLISSPLAAATIPQKICC